MMSKRLFFTLLAASTVAAPAYAQFDSMDSLPDLPAWEQFKLNPKTRIELDFRNASPDAVVEKLSLASGIPIIKDPALTGGINLQSPKPQSLTTAFAMLNAALNLRDYEITKQNAFLVIKPRARGFGGFGNAARGAMGSGSFGGPGGGNSRAIILRVYSIKYANATQVARMINEVFTGLAGMDTTPPTTPTPPGTTAPTGGDQQTTPRRGRRGSASLDVSPDEANSVQPVGQFGGFGGGRGGFGGGGFGGGGGFPNFGAGGNQRNAATTSLVKASADDFSNSVIVNAPAREQGQIAQILEQVDKRTDQPQQTKVFKLTYANANNLVAVIQNVLVSNAPRGRGGIGSQQVPVNQLFQQAARLGSAQASFGTVAADTRTNTLVVTATDENLLTVGSVIAQLDKPTAFASTTYVFPLKNARADVIAQLLNSSFSSKNGTASNFNNLISGSVVQTTNGQSRTTSSTSNSGGPPTLGRGARNGRGVTAGNESATSRAASPEPQTFGGGGFGGGGFGGGGGGQFRPGGQTGNGTSSAAGQPQVAIDANGQVVNLRDPSGLTAVPDVNTNSIIVVTTPDNKELIEKVVNQLDKIPEQVMIETLVVEASLDATNKFGVEWNFKTGQSALSSAFGLAAGAATQPQGLEYTLTNSQYGAFLQAIKTDTRFDVLSTPRIFTSNNATAEINISQSLPYVTNQTVDTTGALFYNYSFLDVGIILTVTPRITSNGYVTMDVDQTANDFVDYTSFNAPVVNQREASTTVSVKDGETIVLGGIIQSQNTRTINKIPLLGDLPLLGQFFRSHNSEKVKTELLVFLTPHVVRDAAEATALRQMTEKSLQPSTQQTLKDFRKLDQTVAPSNPLGAKEKAAPGGTVPPSSGTPTPTNPAPTNPAPTNPAPTQPTTPPPGQ